MKPRNLEGTMWLAALSGLLAIVLLGAALARLAKLAAGWLWF